MIFDGAGLTSNLTLHADLCVVGAGAGGATAAMIAAEAGLRVVVLEAGEHLTPGDMSQREEEMFPRLYWDAGARTTRDRGVKVHQGKGVGGSTLHNLNLVKRIPEPLIERWVKERGLRDFGVAEWRALYDEVEALLQVSAVPRDKWNRHNRLLEEGCARLGWRGGGLSHNRTGCIGSGFCELGCAFDAKNNALKVMVPRALAAGAEIVTRCQVIRVLHSGGKVTGVAAVTLDEQTGRHRGELTVKAARVCLAASATATPAILLRSGVPHGGELGARLHLHPAVVVAGDFDEPVRAWEGIPQTYECTEHLQLERDDGPRTWIVPAFAHPVGTAALVPGHGRAHRDVMLRYPHLAALTAMVHDRTRGAVEPRGDLGLTVDYWPDASDRAELSRGMAACARLLFAAGARRVIVPTRPLRVLSPGDSLDGLARWNFGRGDLDVSSVHPMGSAPMGEIEAATFDSHGRHRRVAGLFAADGSILPGSIGVPPQLSIYALGLRVGRAIARG
ncbi:MAG: GMC family oxidoreductase [Polyangiaceae bacterium]|nr:GMC family oxidoreductase [Polyangiaceae bacterium]